MSLQGKIALITVALGGPSHSAWRRTGRSINYQKNAQAAAEVTQEIGGEAIAVQGDLGTVAGVRQFFQALDTELTKCQGTTSSSTTPGSAGNRGIDHRGGIRRTHGREREGPVLRGAAGHRSPTGRRPGE